MPEISTLLPMKKLDEELIKIINKEVNNKELIKNINAIFAKKNLTLKTVACLFNGSKSIREIDTMEKIAFTYGCYETLKVKRKNNKSLKDEYIYREELDPANYFSDQILVRYEIFMSESDVVNIVEFKNFIMIDDNNSRGNVSLLDVYKYRKNTLWLYNRSTQRAPEIVPMGNSGEYTYRNSVDEKAVKEMTEAILDGKFEETEVILNVRLIPDKEPDVKVVTKGKSEGIADIIVTPNYDINSENYTVVEILDGYHRILAIEEAVRIYHERTGEWLKGCIGVKLVFADEKRALRIVRQTFKRTATDEQYLKSIEEDDISMFVDKIINKSSILKLNVGNVYEECLAFGKITYKSLLNDTIRKLGIDVTKRSSANFTSDFLAKGIDEIYEIINDIYKDDKDILCNPNIIAGYVKAIYEMINKELDAEDIIVKALKLSKKDIRDMKLNSRDCILDKILEYFEVI